MPPLLKRRDGQQGAPLFGSDALRFRASAADGDGDGGGTLLLLFLRRSDLRAAARERRRRRRHARGAGDRLRTLAWQMQVDGAQDWRPFFVAPQPSIDYVQRAQEQADDDGDAPPLTRNDVMGLLFPQADAARRMRCNYSENLKLNRPIAFFAFIAARRIGTRRIICP